MKGKIIKGIAGFYYVHVPQLGVYECKAKGIFRKKKIKPLVGDFVEINILEEAGKLGNIEKIYHRSNQLVRPAVSNVDQAMVIFSIVKPNPNYNLLDRFLIMMAQLHLETIICFNKLDIGTEKEVQELEAIYKNCGCKLIFCSAEELEGMDIITKALLDKTTTVAGPSGVGKSTIINNLQTNVLMETGIISSKIGRGKHTTRHSELIAINETTYIVDTPGFSSLHMFNLEKEELARYYPEFEEYEGMCKFQGCSHIHEPKCGIKEALSEGKIHKVRYHNYMTLYTELKEKRKY